MDSASEDEGQELQDLPSGNRRLPDSSKGLYLTLSSAPLKFDRVQNLKDQLSDEFPTGVCNKVVNSLWDSSMNKYGNLFENFKEFIYKEYGKDNKFPLLGVVMYFNHLIDRGLAYSTMKGYRAALGPILTEYFPEYCLAKDAHFKAVLEGVNRRNPSNTHQFPGWDPDKVP